MRKPLIKFIAEFGPLLIFFIIYFYEENDLKVAIPPFVIATLISLIVIYLLEKSDYLKKVQKKKIISNWQKWD